MSDTVQHKFVTANRVQLHIAEQGQGPLVLLLHGFPESWYSWRHQLGALSAAGYRVVAPDQRGYARSQQPEAVEKYSMLHLTHPQQRILRIAEGRACTWSRLRRRGEPVAVFPRGASPGGTARSQSSKPGRHQDPAPTTIRQMC
ncbi:hypothetical protein GCM10009753_44440 [Streptantibioticus ferralitis]